MTPEPALEAERCAAELTEREADVVVMALEDFAESEAEAAEERRLDGDAEGWIALRDRAEMAYNLAQELPLGYRLRAAAALAATPLSEGEGRPHLAGCSGVGSCDLTEFYCNKQTLAHLIEASTPTVNGWLAVDRLRESGRLDDRNVPTRLVPSPPPGEPDEGEQ